MTLDRDRLELVPEGETVAAMVHDPLRAKHEIRSCMLELATRPRQTATEIRDELGSLRDRVADAAAQRGCVVAGAGTHPFSRPEDQPTADDPRYRAIMREVGFPWRQALVFGTHVHVAVATADKAIGVSEALLADLPLLIALGSTSPFWCGEDTGFASTRLALLAMVPRTGLPPAFTSFGEYDAGLRTLRRAGSLPDASQVWWDVRCQPHFGTVEVRVLDAQSCPATTAALAGLVQALVRWHGRRWDAGVRTVPERFVLAENRWEAVRYGLAARLAGPCGTSAGAADLVAPLLRRLDEDLHAVDAAWVVPVLTDLARDGGSPARLRAAFRAGSDLLAVTRSLLWRPAAERCGGGAERTQQVG